MVLRSSLLGVVDFNSIFFFFFDGICNIVINFLPRYTHTVSHTTCPQLWLQVTNNKVKVDYILLILHLIKLNNNINNNNIIIIILKVFIIFLCLKFFSFPLILLLLFCFLLFALFFSFFLLFLTHTLSRLSFFLWFIFKFLHILIYFFWWWELNNLWICFRHYRFILISNHILSHIRHLNSIFI